MTEEKMKRGKELLEKPDQLKDQKSRWERGWDSPSRISDSYFFTKK